MIVRSKWARLASLLYAASAALGAISSVAIALLACSLSQQMALNDRRNQASDKELKQVVDWAGLVVDSSPSRVGSFQSSRSFNGDHLDAYCLGIGQAAIGPPWTTLGKTEPAFSRAVGIALESARSELSCLPTDAQLASWKILVRILSIDFRSDQPYGMEIAFVDRSRNQLFFISSKY
jgi:hypothetical protein